MAQGQNGVPEVTVKRRATPKTARLESRPSTQRPQAWLPLLGSPLRVAEAFSAGQAWGSPVFPSSECGGEESRLSGQAPGSASMLSRSLLPGANGSGVPSQRCCELIRSVAQEAAMWEAVLVRAQQGWPAGILLELLSAFGHTSLGYKERNQIRTFPFCPCFENWDQIHFGPQSPDMSSFIPPRMGPVDGRKDRAAWVLVLGDLWPRLSQCAGLGEGCSHSCSRGSKPQEGQECP